jgi:hypothetical protein
MDVHELAPGLWRWTARHPAWTPDSDWEPEVGSVYWETGDAVVLIDPLVPEDAGERTRFWRALDRDVGRLGLSVEVLLTCAWHARSSAEVAERYAARIHQPDVGEETAPGAARFAAGAALPGGAHALLATPASDEAVYWLPGARAVVPGDSLIGSPEGVGLCPESWLGPGGRPALVEALLPLLDLPVERVLVSHGGPVLAEGRAALAAALR